jgi:hypothetical protein
VKPFGKSDGDRERRIRTMELVLIRSLGKLEFRAFDCYRAARQPLSWACAARIDSLFETTNPTGRDSV